MSARSLFLVVGLLFQLCGLPASAQDPAWHFEFTNGVPHKLVWQAENAKSYDLWQSTDLKAWQHVDGFPQVGTGGAMSFAFTPGSRGFFKFVTTTLDGEFALIPAGTFQMGNQSGFEGNDFGQRPVHSVYVSAFQIERTEVTKAVWDEVREWGLDNGYTDLAVGLSKGVNHPVVSIIWKDMIKWCNARSHVGYSSSSIGFRTVCSSTP